MFIFINVHFPLLFIVNTSFLNNKWNICMYIYIFTLLFANNILYMYVWINIRKYKHIYIFCSYICFIIPLMTWILYLSSDLCVAKWHNNIMQLSHRTKKNQYSSHYLCCNNQALNGASWATIFTTIFHRQNEKFHRKKIKKKAHKNYNKLSILDL